MFKTYFISISLIILIGLMQGTLVLGQEDKQRIMDERAIIKEKIEELEKIVGEKGSEDLKKELEELKNLEKVIDAEDLKAQQERIKKKESALYQETIKAQQKRIKEIEKKIEESAIPPARIKEIEKKIEESAIPPARIKEIEEEFNIKTMTTKDPILLRQYFGCKAVLENDVKICNKIQDPNGIKECQQNFHTFPLFLDKIMRDKRITSDILNTCKQIFSASEGDCRLVIDACISGDVSAISVMPYFEGIDGLIGLAIISGDNKYCCDISSQSEKTNCNSNAAYTSAVKSGFSWKCLEIENVSLRTTCQLYFNKDKSICEEFLKTQISQRRR
ncbi:MAG: hypothetical protein COX41_06275 [Candidatus Omnitrophica bacterium CG23_combo_of_CG06-09_8_20_14_all_41_10]|uniref:Uncharacterized protein n=1 Tax=Candidatus Sherwoodlollariibacterium unditelluris TaxID=1974757 RepID=A0A2G9YHS8_9BACT|nr:MAG: hypothetical protein COX41_06275 [Candidatus Omnitrophica bacterium CG23_combo_of_CG06-09_8_20_14_all_41_10]